MQTSKSSEGMINEYLADEDLSLPIYAALQLISPTKTYGDDQKHEQPLFQKNTGEDESYHASLGSSSRDDLSRPITKTSAPKKSKGKEQPDNFVGESVATQIDDMFNRSNRSQDVDSNTPERKQSSFANEIDNMINNVIPALNVTASSSQEVLNEVKEKLVELEEPQIALKVETEAFVMRRRSDVGTFRKVDSPGQSTTPKIVADGDKSNPPTPPHVPKINLATKPKRLSNVTPPAPSSPVTEGQLQPPVNLGRRASLHVLDKIDKREGKTLNASQANLSDGKTRTTVSTLIERFSSGIMGSAAEVKSSDPALSPRKLAFDKNLLEAATRNARKPDDTAIASSPTLEVSKPSGKSRLSSFTGRRRSDLESSSVAAIGQSTNLNSAKSTSVNSLEGDDERDAAGDLKKRAGLQRSHAVFKKGPNRKSIGGTSQNSLTAVNSSVELSGMRKSSSGYNMAPHEKIKYFYRCIHQMRYLCDDMCETLSAFCNKCVAWHRSGQAPSDMETDIFITVAKDMAVQCNEFNLLYPESRYCSLLRRCQAQFENIVRSQWESLSLKDRETESQKMLLRGRKLCAISLTLAVCSAADYAQANNLIPIMPVPGWKIEGVGLDSLKTWLTVSYSESEADGTDKLIEDFAIDLEDSEDLVVSLSLKAKKEKLSKSDIKEKSEKSAKSELLSHIKPTYFVHQKHARISNQGFKNLPGISFFNGGNIVTDSKSQVIAPVDYFDTDTLTYRRQFVGKDHRNYFGANEKFAEFAISIKREPKETNEGNDNAFQYRVLFRSKNVGRLVHLVIPEADVLPGSKMSLFNKESSIEAAASEKVWKNIIQAINPKLEMSKMKRFDVSTEEEENEQGKLRTPSKIEKSLQQLDEHRTAFSYKFGLMYVQDGQSNETQWFDNTETSSSFKSFCNILGDTILQKGHTGFSGGLDTKNGNTGEQSVYTKWRYDPNGFIASPVKSTIGQPDSTELEFEIMYHCSPLLPYTPGDEQQIQRKRHIGNDLITVVFIEKDASSPQTEELVAKALFDPRRIKSQFLHVYVVVQEVTWEKRLLPGAPRILSADASTTTAYRVYTTSMVDVPNFAPSLADPPVFPVGNDEERRVFRDYIIAKLVNAENAAFEAQRFRSLHSRAYNGLLETLLREVNSDVKLTNPSTRVSISDKRKSSKASNDTSDTEMSGATRKNSTAFVAELGETKETLSAMLSRHINTSRSRAPTKNGKDSPITPGDLENSAVARKLSAKPEEEAPVIGAVQQLKTGAAPKLSLEMNREVDFLDFLNSDPAELKEKDKEKKSTFSAMRGRLKSNETKKEDEESVDKPKSRIRRRLSISRGSGNDEDESSIKSVDKQRPRSAFFNMIAHAAVENQPEEKQIPYEESFIVVSGGDGRKLSTQATSQDEELTLEQILGLNPASVNTA